MSIESIRLMRAQLHPLICTTSSPNCDCNSEVSLSTCVLFHSFCNSEASCTFCITLHVYAAGCMQSQTTHAFLIPRLGHICELITCKCNNDCTCHEMRLDQASSTHKAHISLDQFFPRNFTFEHFVLQQLLPMLKPENRPG